MSFSAQGLHARRFKSLRAIIALLLREMTTSYGRSPGGYLWAVLEPVGGLAVMTLAFSMAFRSPALGDNFPLFYATGYLPFIIYTDLVAKVSHAIRFSKSLLFYPAVTFVDAIVARFILNALTQIVVFFLITTGITWYFDTGNIIDYAAILNAICMALMLGLGVGTFNCYFASRFPVWERLWAIFNRPMFLISAVFFLFEGIPEPFRSYLWYNPLVHIIGETRRGFYATYSGDYVSPTYVYSIALFCFFIGLVFLNRYHRELIINR